MTLSLFSLSCLELFARGNEVDVAKARYSGSFHSPFQMEWPDEVGPIRKAVKVLFPYFSSCALVGAPSTSTYTMVVSVPSAALIVIVFSPC